MSAALLVLTFEGRGDHGRDRERASDGAGARPSIRPESRVASIQAYEPTDRAFSVFTPTLGSRLRAGDTIAFTALVADVVPALIRYATARVGNRADAEEIVQDVFAKLWVGRSSIPDQLTCGYLFRAVRNALLDVAAHRRVSDAYATHTAQDDAAASDPAATADATLTLESLLARLSERRRQAIELRYWGQLSHAQIGDTLGISPANAERLVARGLADLKRLAEAAG